MDELARKLQRKLSARAAKGALRQLKVVESKTDLSSNDYLGFARSEALHQEALRMVPGKFLNNGSTGSRLLSGNNELFETTEKFLSDFYRSEAALIFNSGYDANLGLFASIPQRGDLILYDEYVHASIRDGIRASNARNLKFRHNDLEDLKRVIGDSRNPKISDRDEQAVYVVTESVFSMDGDSPDLISLADLCQKEDCYLIVDEAHAAGLYGQDGAGLIVELGLENKVFARIVTFGKALGSHGAAVLGSKTLRDYLVNFARSFIYTTALSPHSVCTIFAGHKLLSSTEGQETRSDLRSRIEFFRSKLMENGLKEYFITSFSSIQSCILPGNDTVKRVSNSLYELGYDVRPILSPTVPEGRERLRFCLHSYNSEEEINSVLVQLALSLDRI